MTLDNLPLALPAYIDRVDWDSMSAAEAQRLQELGIWEGVSIEVLHRMGWNRRGALACRVGRMTIAMCHAHAAAIAVSTGAATSPVGRATA